MATDYELRVHRDWIGLLQPVGLVVSPPALLAAQAFPDKNILKEQHALLALITPPAPKDEKKQVEHPPLPLSFEALATKVLSWKPSKLAGSPSGPPLPESLDLVLPEFGETLRPTYAIPAVNEDDAEWMIIVQELNNGTSFDDPPADETKKWHASPQIRLERLLRETGVPIGILTNGRFVRLVYAPRGESSGHITWPVHRLTTALDRDMLSALCMLLGSARLFTLPREQRLPHILKESRKYQNVVSTKLAGQVLEALNELLRGFQSANEVTKGRLLDMTVREDPDHVYGGLLAALLRLVFILYAEERGLLSSSAAYVRNYSLVSLFNKLRIDAGRFPDTMDQRYGAWSRLLVLFRMVHDGAKRGDLCLPPRYGHLFDPDSWAFLEGRPLRINRVMGAPVEVPKVPDGVVLRVLEKLLLLDSERLSYRALDVEQIGSVYENMMGFRLERAIETSIGVGKEHVVVGLETLLAKKCAEREKLLKETVSVELTGKASEALKEAATVDDLVAALSRRISPLTPRTVPAGGLYLQPTDERRRSGSHYTPRELTEPIVRTTLQPILEDLGPSPKPEQLLALKVCDPAMGSGAFLVETCRQLAEKLVKAYDVHGRPTDIPPDEDVLLYAQRHVAQHCLYGVDKNPFAVDLGKLSLWLATLARDHAFTFLDHSIRHGDSLVGLTREQIASFHWAPEKQLPMIRTFVEKAISEAMALRAKIPDLANSDDVREKRQLLRDADDALAKVRMVGDAVVASFFAGDGATEREAIRKNWESMVGTWLTTSQPSSQVADFTCNLRSGERPVPCFHWEIEFPEVFQRVPAGFDAIVGNPPFLGGRRLSTAFGDHYADAIRTFLLRAKGSANLVGYFLVLCDLRTRSGGRFGIVATSSLVEGETRTTTLRPMLLRGDTITWARTKVPWPGEAGVHIVQVSLRKGPYDRPRLLDGFEVACINSRLEGRAEPPEPVSLAANKSLHSDGVKVQGIGFVISNAEAKELLDADERNSAVVHRYVTGEDINSLPHANGSRWVINFLDMAEEDARSYQKPFRILEERVKPYRDGLTRQVHETCFWKFWDRREEFFERCSRLSRIIVTSKLSKYRAVTFGSVRNIYSEKVKVFASDDPALLGILQSQLHDLWSLREGATTGETPAYSGTKCFNTFALPPLHAFASIREAGAACVEQRTAYCEANAVGLTDFYNRFHDAGETAPAIVMLRDLHEALDRAVLAAYGWTDIEPPCAFIPEDDDAESGAVEGERQTKQSWRYRWSDDVRDEVLARLLELNAQRANEQAGTPTPAGQGTSPAVGGKKPRGRGKAKKPTPAGQGGLFGEENE